MLSIMNNFFGKRGFVTCTKNTNHLEKLVALALLIHNNMEENSAMMRPTGLETSSFCSE